MTDRTRENGYEWTVTWLDPNVKPGEQYTVIAAYKTQEEAEAFVAGCYWTSSDENLVVTVTPFAIDGPNEDPD